MFDFGMRLRELRKQHGFSQAQLSKKVDIHKSAISKYENNISTPSLEFLVRISVLYNVTLDYITGIERHRTLILDGLTDKQCVLLQSLYLEFQPNSSSIKKPGLTPTQLSLLNDVIIEFSSSQ